MRFPSLDEILSLSVTERVRLAHLLWQSVEEIPEGIPLTPEVRNEIERRLDAYERDPDAGSSWEEVKVRLKRPK